MDLLRALVISWTDAWPMRCALMESHADGVGVGSHRPAAIGRRVRPEGEHQPLGVVTGGGSGHKPAFVGYLGRNMVDAVAVGEVFTSPGVRAFVNAFKAADGGKGVACLYGNYAGDNLNVKMAVKMVARDGLVVKTVIANDDVASAPKKSAKSAAAWPERYSCGRWAAPRRPWAAASTRSSRRPRRPSTTAAASAWASRPAPSLP